MVRTSFEDSVTVGKNGGPVEGSKTTYETDHDTIRTNTQYEALTLRNSTF